jgi:hypothetical protein
VKENKFESWIRDQCRFAGRVLYHGLTNGPIKQPIRTPFFVAHDEELAKEYGENVVKVVDTSKNPLILDTPDKCVRAWNESGASSAEGSFHPDRTSRVCDWAKSLGHDSVVIPQSAFDGELGYKEVSGRWGEPQTIFLDPGAFRIESANEETMK